MIRRPKGPTAKRRAARGRRLKAGERVNKAAARKRDGALHHQVLGRCRFPICGCHALGGADRPGSKSFIEVSHFERHKGMGGDPTGERSLPERLICVCNWRHKDGQFAIDKKKLRAVPLTAAGANGPVAWEMFLDISGWFELARETAVQVLAPIEPNRISILTDLAKMRT